MDKASLIMYNQYPDDRIGIYAGKCFRGINFINFRLIYTENDNKIF